MTAAGADASIQVLTSMGADKYLDLRYSCVCVYVCICMYVCVRTYLCMYV